jgi:hypothetical protein
MSKLPIYSDVHSCCETESTDDEGSREMSNQKANQANACKYKTEICKNFSEMGSCPYRSKCQFAHGQEELLQTASAPRKAYRTKKCKSFWEEGVCRYGFRCQFLHYSSGTQKAKGFLQTAYHMFGHQPLQTSSRLTAVFCNHPI